MDIKVSIIIPVYNVADYLRRCLDSCVNQTLQDIEIIVVNDSSPDPRDTDIMREYERLFPDKVRCIWHEKNICLGGARNTAIRSARSEFIYCLDSDDYIDLELCEKMYTAIVSENADMAVCNTNRVEGNIVTKNWAANGSFNTSDLCERIRNIKAQAAWFIMIKKIVIDENNLYFQEHLVCEDFTCLLWYLASPKIIRVNEALHYYCIRYNSIAEERKYYMSGIQVIRYISNYVFFDNLDAAVKKELFFYFAQHIMFYFQDVCISYPDEFIKLCHSVLDLLKVYKIDCSYDIRQSEYSVYIRKIFSFIEQNIDAHDFNIEFLAYYESCKAYYNRIKELRIIRRLLPLYTGKRLTVWGCGVRGKSIAESLSVSGVKFEITDVNAKTHGKRITANAAVKPWCEIKERTDVVLVAAVGIFEEVRGKLAKECPDVEVIDLIALLE